MNVYEALDSRLSVRDFLPTPVPAEVIRRVLAAAVRSPSGGNLQPWQLHVLAGEPLAALKATMQQRVVDAPRGEDPEAEIYPPGLVSPYNERRLQCGEDMYGTLGIPRDDKAARRQWFARNFAFFGAPMAMFCTIDRSMGRPQWADLGLLLQSVMLLLRAEGLDSCPQACWTLYPDTIARTLGLAPEQRLYCGLAIGWRHPEHPVNQLRTQRAGLDEAVRFIGV